MGEILDKWRLDHAPIDDGIYFPDDSMVPMVGLDAKSPRRSLPPLSELQGWQRLYLSKLLENSDRIVLGGSTPWEGCGVLAVVERQGSGLLWLLCSSESEPFVSAEVDGESLIAVSEEYPRRIRWRFILERPWELEAREERM